MKKKPYINHKKLLSPQKTMVHAGTFLTLL